MLINTSIIFLLTSIITVSFCRKYNFLLDKKSEKHKKYLSNHKSHLIGGFLLFLSLFYFFLFIEIDFFLLSFLFIIFVIVLGSNYWNRGQRVKKMVGPNFFTKNTAN